MATLYGYKCENCGFEINAPVAGYDTWMAGEVFFFRCSSCNEVFRKFLTDMTAPRFAKTQKEFFETFDRSQIKCPKCDCSEQPRVWNPVDCGCPKCGKPLSKTGTIINAD